jgi:hypothetical protein
MPAIAQIVCASPVVNSAFVTIGLVLSRSSVVVRAQGRTLAVADADAARGSPGPPDRPSGLRVKR